MPLSIRDPGVQHPFNDGDFTAATLRDSDTGYTAGSNLFWRDGVFTPTPGIPVRTETFEDIVECYFHVPAAMPHNIIISLARPLDKRGALCTISPEEARHAMMAAIARDIDGGLGVGSPGRVAPQSPQLHGDLPRPCRRGGAPPSGDATPREHGTQP